MECVEWWVVTILSDVGSNTGTRLREVLQRVFLTSQ